MLVDRFTNYRTRYGLATRWAVEAEMWWRLEHAGVYRGGDGGLFGHLRRYASGRRKAVERRAAPLTAPPSLHMGMIVPVTDANGEAGWLSISEPVSIDNLPWATDPNPVNRAAYCVHALMGARAVLGEYTGYDMGWPGRQ